MADKAVGTHMGHLDGEARHRRAVKNQRNRSRRGSATRPIGAIKKVTSRLHTRGGRNQRGGR